MKLTENACEGMVPIQELPGDRYNFDANKMIIVGQKTGKEFHFGDAVRVRISEVSPRKRTIDLELVSHKG